MGTQAAAVGAAVGPALGCYRSLQDENGIYMDIQYLQQVKRIKKKVLNRLESTSCTLFFPLSFQVAFIFRYLHFGVCGMCRISRASTGLAQAGMLVGGLGLGRPTHERGSQKKIRAGDFRCENRANFVMKSLRSSK